MSQNLPANDFKCVEETSQFNEDLKKIYNEDCDVGYVIEADVLHVKTLYELHHDLSFLPERMKFWKTEKLVAIFHDKKEYVIHLRNLKQTLNYGFWKKSINTLNWIKSLS